MKAGREKEQKKKRTIVKGRGFGASRDVVWVREWRSVPLIIFFTIILFLLSHTHRKFPFFFSLLSIFFRVFCCCRCLRRFWTHRIMHVDKKNCDFFFLFPPFSSFPPSPLETNWGGEKRGERRNRFFLIVLFFLLLIYPVIQALLSK